MNKNVYILGGGSQARETYQIYKDNNQSDLVKGFVITNPTDLKTIWDKPVFPPEILKSLDKNALLMCAVGSCTKRARWVKELKSYGLKFDLVSHPSAVIGTNVTLGEGTTICANTVLTCDITIGRHVIINVNASVSHDTVLGNFVSLAPGVNIAGKVIIGESTFVGLNSAVIQGTRIGKNCFLGAGSVVVSDIPDNSLAYGVPAKIVRSLSLNDWEKLI